MNYYYSKSTKGFYNEEIHGKNIPSDCVEITAEYHGELLNKQSKGKVIQPDEKGYPVAVDYVPPAPTWEEIRARRNILLQQSDWSAFPDANPKPSKQAWLDYRQALRDIPTSFPTPEEVVWPQKPE